MSQVNEATIRVSQSLRDIAKSLDQQIENAAVERVGFALVVFTDGRVSYVSNSSREHCMLEIKNLLEIWEQGMPGVPAHEAQ